jgi:UDP-N-acetylmuramate dehydrogenase
MPPLDVREHVPLAPFSTLGIGGPARYFARAETDEDVREAVRWAEERRLPLLVVGGGSNLVISDDGHPGLALHVATRGVDVQAAGTDVQVTAAAGEPWEPLVARVVGEGWAGLECLSGIPGLVGATPMQNVGAYGQEVAETITRVDALDRRTGEVVSFTNPECRFAYRHSRFKAEDRDRYVILRVAYSLKPDAPPALRYAELSRYLEEKGASSPSLAQVRDAIVTLRRRKSMVLDPDDPNARSVGSFFMNPIVPAATAEALEDRLRQEGVLRGDERPPRFPAGEGRVKLSAAWLIERSGLGKGFGEGRAGLSTRHTLAIVNRGGATAGDVVALARQVRDRVRDRFGVSLVPEPVFVHVSLD